MLADTLHVIDAVACYSWCGARVIGLVYIAKSWAVERKLEPRFRRQFYIWFTVSWTLMAVSAVLFLLAPQAVLGRVVVALSSTVCDLVGFHHLGRYVRSRYAFIRKDLAGNLHFETVTPLYDPDDEVTSTKKVPYSRP